LCPSWTCRTSTLGPSRKTVSASSGDFFNDTASQAHLQQTGTSYFRGTEYSGVASGRRLSPNAGAHRKDLEDPELARWFHEQSGFPGILETYDDAGGQHSECTAQKEEVWARNREETAIWPSMAPLLCTVFGQLSFEVVNRWRMGCR
jgi:hypothetical protein